MDDECKTDMRSVHILEIPLGVKKDSVGIKKLRKGQHEEVTRPQATLQTTSHNSYPFQSLSSSLLLLTGTIILFLVSWRML
jgi:hypothetical protein